MKSKAIIQWVMSAGVLLLAACSNETVEPISEKKIRSNYVSQEEAKNSLKDLLADINKSKTRSGEEGVNTDITNSYTTTAYYTDSLGKEYHHDLHVFNIGDKEGFAIMNSDVRSEGLMALSFEGELPENKEFSPQLSLFLDEMLMHQIRDIVEEDTVDHEPDVEPYELYGPWENTYYGGPTGMCKVTWAQYSPYNELLPLVNGEHPDAGCAVVALAQFMSIYWYPYIHNGYTYKWYNMTANKEIDYCSPATKESVQRLYQQLSLEENLDADYEDDPGVNDLSKAVVTLGNFGYSNPGTFEDYNFSKVLSELKAGYPVLMSGASVKTEKKHYWWFIHTGTSIEYSGVHAWVIDGLLERKREKRWYDGYSDEPYRISYETHYYLCCKWGWGLGFYDGFYSSYGFNPDQGAVYPVTARTRTTGANNFQYVLKMVTGVRK